ncbi:hypothetical protein CJJ07_001091 [Candidozyma auris]|nr:hypothetical protein CJJ07_001091 [[Candida] auris]QEL58659.1 hypothetical protein CJJ09_000707 [[Candida] auris]
MPPRKSAASRPNGSERNTELPGIKHNAPKSRNFFPSDSDDSGDEETPPRKKQAQKNTRAILGGANGLKAMFSNSQEAAPREQTESSVDSTPIKKIPAKRGRKPKSAILTSPEAPLTEASTPKSMLKRATSSIKSPDTWSNIPIRYDDVEAVKSPKRRGRPRKNKEPGNLPKRRKRKQDNTQEVPNDSEYVEQKPEHTLQPTDGENASRRSSYSIRGKRVSAIGNGFVGKPHDEMSEREYFKVVDSSLPAPSRLRQILVWCFRKKLQQDREGDGAETNTAKGIAKEIKNEILEDLIAQEIDTSWYSAKKLESGELQGKRIIKSNPLNDANRESIEVFQQKLRELRQEKMLWQSAFDASIKPLEGLGVHSINPKDAAGGKDSREFQEYVRSKDPNFGDVLQEKHLDALAHQVAEVQASVPKKLEANMAQMYHTVYQLGKSVELAGRIEQEQLAPQVTHAVKEFMERGRNSDKVVPLGARELLRGISRVDLENK